MTGVNDVADVAVIGVGLHPFGRFEGKSAMEMGADAIQPALADAGIDWKDIRFAVGGSWTVANPDAIPAPPESGRQDRRGGRRRVRRKPARTRFTRITCRRTVE